MASALLLTLSHYVDAACVPASATNVTCSENLPGGVQSGTTPLSTGGVLSSPPTTTLNVRNLTANVNPASGKSGIQLLTNGTPGKDEQFGAGSVFGSGPDGGDGGRGGNVTIDYVGNAFEIITQGTGAHGIFARSIGGKGGSGGWATGFPIPPLFILTGPAFGGDGGDANDGGTVTVRSEGAITTSGGSAHGILAESRGGSGGDGGWAFSTTAAEGGDGGKGASGGNVTVTNKGTIKASGAKSSGIYAHSEGGKGGAGGRGDGSFGIGGAGQGTGNGGSVTVTNDGKITTGGVESDAILVNSTGGGGGDGGGAGGIFTFGGDGASAGHGGAVTVTNRGDLDTTRENSSGILAQSFGGGGGNGGGSISAGLFVSAAFGGTAGPGGNGAPVTVGNLLNGDGTSPVIVTRADESHGIHAMSVGGGGGTGGFAISAAVGEKFAGSVAVGGSGGDGGRGDVVDVTSFGQISTTGFHAHGIFAESLGGGGGSGGFSIAVAGSDGFSGSLAIGGSGGKGGDGRTVTVDNLGGITTNLEQSHGIFAQSVGGGGGDGGFSIAAALSTKAALALSFGGKGGVAGHGDAVEVTNSGTITTNAELSHGIFGQSLGGAGGAGGFSISAAAVVPTAPTSGALSFSMGGAGGTGNEGNTVFVENTGTINTHGKGSYGVIALSQGGGGGHGGFSGSLAGFGENANIAVAIGGAGGTGSNSDAVTVKNSGEIATSESGSYGIFAQSLGGGGGDAGFGLSVAVGGVTEVVTKTTPSGNLSVAVGGKGGGGGFAGTVDVENEGGITTKGDKSAGIFAYSIGGGGGNGGFSVAGTLRAALAQPGSAATQSSPQASVSVGGAGGNGNYAEAVEVINFGVIATEGAESSGIVAKSEGGGGGNGGFSFAGSFASAAATGGLDPKALPVNVSVAVGGGGGNGSSGGEVTVKNCVVDAQQNCATNADNSGSSIITKGDKSHGIWAESLGGGGGDGGMSFATGLGIGGGADTWNVNVNVAVGGKGGGGQNIARKVDVDNRVAITTEGNDSHGIWAQSIGGGGGNGGSSFAGTFGLGGAREGRTIAAQVAVGGGGGNGNHGGEVRVNNEADIHTKGDQSHGIWAQSIGGGGGNGGDARALHLITDAKTPNPFAKATGNNWAFTASVGGDGGGASNGDEVTVIHSGTIVTEGASARGIWAQSIGGGGGSAGSGFMGTGTALEDATGVPFLDFFTLASQVGVLHDLSLIVGGDGGSSGIAKKVLVQSTGDILTSGLFSHGVYAQSIGGGGGEAQQWAKGEGQGGNAEIGATGKVGIGGKGGAFGDGGEVEVTHDSGLIHTKGCGAFGIFAQSIGGGGGVAGGTCGTLPEIPVSGGTAGEVVRALGSDINIGLGLAFTQGAGGGGSGMAVRVDNKGAILTEGDDSHGILAQSIGGGGGVANGISILNPKLGVLYGSTGANGSGGPVTVKHSGSITTKGISSHGIFAQSAGGTGTGDTVDIAVGGNVTAEGKDAHGILAQSRGDAGASDITVTIEDNATVQGGTESGAGVHILDGAANTVTNNKGTITGASGTSGWAITALDGAETISNGGTITGNVSLGAGANAFNNRPDGTFNSGATIALGAGNLLSNGGTLSPGGRGVVLATGLTGNLRQTGTGIYALDLDHAAQATDRVDASGTADLAGKTRIQNLNTGSARSGVRTYTILTGAGGVSDSGFSVDAAQAAVISYRLVYTNNTDVLLQTSVDFSPAQGLNANQRAIGANINAIQNSGGTSSFAPVAGALFALPDTQALATAYDQLSAEGYLPTGTSTVYANEGFSNAMLSCRVRDGEFRFVREGDCGWMRVTKGTVNQDQTSDNLGFHEDAIYLAGGFQRAIGGNWHAGLGVAYQDGDIDVDGLSHTTGDQVQIGAVLKGRTGPTTYSAAATIGKGWYDTNRYVNIPTPGVVAVSNQNVGLAGARFRVAREWLLGKDAYVRPMIDAAVTYARFDGFNEAGAGGANLLVAGRSETWFSVAPAVEVGGELELADRTLVRPSLKLGITQFVSGTDPSITASFAGAPAGVAPYTVNGEFDRTYLDVDAGVDVLSVNGAVLRVGYLGRFSSNVSANGATLKFSMPF